ncbi:MAG: DUF47 family protein [Kiritimatiellae bacterium]|nr:DUF47 family protein [Kiritimatiellia bacterium]
MKREVRNILGWLGIEEGRSTLVDAERHIEETCKTVAALADAVRAFISGDLTAKTIAIEKVKEQERAADKVRTAMVDRLTEGLLLPPDREDLMRFAHALDKIADSTNKAARILGLIESPLPENVLKNMAIGTDQIVRAVAQLKEAIHAMTHNEVRTALQHCNEVERLEHDADDQKRILLDAILHAKLDPPTLLLSYNLAEALEAITDKIDTVADMVRLICVKSE